MLRLAGTLLLVFVLAGLVAWLAIQPGEIVATWRGTRIATDATTAAVLAAIVLALAVFVPLGLARFGRVPARMRGGRAERRRRRGEQAVTAGMVAVAAGDGPAARRQAQIARNLLGDAPLVLLLSAQAAQAEGDAEAAERTFRAMLDQRETEFLGLRGLAVLALRRDDRAAALPLIERARALRPKSPWALNSLFAVACAEGNWMRAGALLDEMKGAGILDQAALRRRRVVVWSAAAQEAEAAGRRDEARALAQRANKLQPDFAPAAIILARRLAAEGDARKAAKLLERAWAGCPHPEIAAAYWALEPSETPAQRLARTRRLVQGAADARESRIVLAEQAIAAGDAEAARTALAPLDAEPTVHVCVLHAALAHAEGDEAAAQDWLQRCMRAGRDPAWLCRECGQESVDWTALCHACGAFDGLHWTAPSDHAAVPMHPARLGMAAESLAGPAAVPAPPPDPEPRPSLPHRPPDDPGLDDDWDADGPARTPHPVA